MTITHSVARNIPADQTDATGMLNEWLATVPDGQPGKPVDVTFSGKDFRCEGTLELVGRKHLRFRNGLFWASTKGDAHRAHWRAIDSTDLKWLNIAVTGPRQKFAGYDANYEWQHGFDFQGVNGYDLAACKVTGVLGDAVCNGRSPTGAWTEGGLIHGTCTFAGTGRQTVSFTAARNITVLAVQVSDPSLSIFDIEPNGPGWGADKITITGAVVLGTDPAHTFSLLYAADYQPGGTVSNIKVRNTSQHGNGVVVVCEPAPGSSYPGIVVTGNATDLPARGYARIRSCPGLVFEGNQVPGGSVDIR